MMIYIAKIAQTINYSTDTSVACEAFSTIEKAEAFMFAQGMSKAGYGLWEKDGRYDFSGEITEMEVK